MNFFPPVLFSLTACFFSFSCLFSVVIFHSISTKSSPVSLSAVFILIINSISYFFVLFFVLFFSEGTAQKKSRKTALFFKTNIARKAYDISSSSLIEDDLTAFPRLRDTDQPLVSRPPEEKRNVFLRFHEASVYQHRNIGEKFFHLFLLLPLPGQKFFISIAGITPDIFLRKPRFHLPKKGEQSMQVDRY